MNCGHFYHLFSAGEWRPAVAEHLAALEDGGFDGPMFVGLVGNAKNRAEAWDEIHTLRPSAKICAQADGGWEQVTLHALQRYARKHDGAILYAHTKGAATQSSFQDQWRQEMTHRLVREWASVRDHLATGSYDAIGCHWLTAEEYPNFQADTPFPMFGGNFWMATTTYLRTLPRCKTTCRHDAEAWIGLRDPRVLDLLPGWPGANPYTRRRMRRLVSRPE